MTGTQYQNSIEKIGLSQREAGYLFGVHIRTSAAWATNEREVPEAVALCLTLLLQSHDDKPRWTEKMIETAITHNKRHMSKKHKEK